MNPFNAYPFPSNDRPSETRVRVVPETPTEFVVLRPDGTERARRADILDAIDIMRALPVGAGVITPDGRLMSYQGRRVSSERGESKAREALAVWKAARNVVGEGAA